MARLAFLLGDQEIFFELCQQLELSSETINKISNARNLATLDSELGEGSLTYVQNVDLLAKSNIPSNVLVLIPNGLELVDFNADYVTVADPSVVFWSIFELVARSKINSYRPSTVNENVVISKNVSISDYGVTIEDSVIIGENVVIKPGVTIRRGSRIGPSTVIGSNGLEVKQTVFGLIVISHTGGVQIDENVEIGALCTINQGLGSEPTYVSSETKIDCGVHVAHSCFIGIRNVIAAHTTFGGSVKTGADVFIGLNATIRNGIRLSDGCSVGASAFVADSHNRTVKLIPYSAKPLAMP